MIFEKIKENYNGSYLYFQNALEYLKEAGIIIEFDNKLLIKNRKSVVLPKDLKGLYKVRIKSFSKNMDASLILAFSTIIGARIDFKTLSQLGIKNVGNRLKMMINARLEIKTELKKSKVFI